MSHRTTAHKRDNNRRDKKQQLKPGWLQGILAPLHLLSQCSKLNSSRLLWQLLHLMLLIVKIKLPICQVIHFLYVIFHLARAKYRYIFKNSTTIPNPRPHHILQAYVSNAALSYTNINKYIEQSILPNKPIYTMNRKGKEMDTYGTPCDSVLREEEQLCHISLASTQGRQWHAAPANGPRTSPARRTQISPPWPQDSHTLLSIPFSLTSQGLCGKQSWGVREVGLGNQRIETAIDSSLQRQKKNI